MRRQTMLARALSVGGTAYCAALVAAEALSALGVRPWWLAIAHDVLAPILFAPVAALGLLALALRMRALGAAVAAAALAFALAFQAALVPPSPTAPTAPARQLRVATYNQLIANTQIDTMLATIRRQDADLVAIQELSHDLAAAIQRDMAGEYPYQWLVPSYNADGLGLISRYPLDRQEQASAYRGLRAVIHVDGALITVVNVHPHIPFAASGIRRPSDVLRALASYGTSPRQGEIEALVAMASQVPGPMIVLGDFNTSDRDPLYAQLAAVFHDSYRQSSWGFGATFPSPQSDMLPFPIVRIDYIWLRGPLAAIASQVDCDSGGSDHCLYVADVALP
ncbi:hypothetical protein F8S13_09245 [Chloroflexia bacterium SDU3-3]|nr:hypothetical protein F8S13_09245 [Chloroflexia bacterium SDU3-3]